MIQWDLRIISPFENILVALCSHSQLIHVSEFQGLHSELSGAVFKKPFQLPLLQIRNVFKMVMIILRTRHQGKHREFLINRKWFYRLHCYSCTT